MESTGFVQVTTLPNRWNSSENPQYAFANSAMVLLCDPPSSYPRCADSSYLPRHIALHWHDVYLPLSRLQTRTRVLFNHRQPHRRGYFHHHYLGVSIVRILQRGRIKAGSTPTATPATLYRSAILKRHGICGSKCFEHHWRLVEIIILAYIVWRRIFVLY